MILLNDALTVQLCLFGYFPTDSMRRALFSHFKRVPDCTLLAVYDAVRWSDTDWLTSGPECGRGRQLTEQQEQKQSKIKLNKQHRQWLQWTVFITFKTRFHSSSLHFITSPFSNADWRTNSTVRAAYSPVLYSTPPPSQVGTGQPNHHCATITSYIIYNFIHVLWARDVSVRAVVLQFDENQVWRQVRTQR